MNRTSNSRATSCAAAVIALAFTATPATASDIPTFAAIARVPVSLAYTTVTRAELHGAPLLVVHGPVQINVSADGVNIPGDAANEPTLAVDPAAPNRMVVAWRQFDDVGAGHRTAGWATTVDGGRTWSFHGAIDGAVWRSDPVLAADSTGRIYYLGLNRGNESCDLFVSDDAGSSWSAPIPAFGGDKPWMSVDPDRRHVYASWQDTIGCCSERVFTRSVNGGLSFSEPIAIDPPPTLGTHAIGPDGELYIAGILDLDDFVVARSLDARDPAQEPTFAISHVDLGGMFWILIPPNPYGLAGQVWVAADTSDGQNRGHVYLACSVLPDGGDDPMDVHFARSEDGGATWSEPIAVASDDRGAWQWFATMSVGPTGRIDLVWVETIEAAAPSIGEIRYSSSTDGGRSWSDPTAVTAPFDSNAGFPPDEKIGDYYHMRSDATGADLVFAATFNGEQDVYSLRIGPYDCNGNEIADDIDIDTSTSGDCNRNGIPDECEIAAGAADDGDGDGVPDDCRTLPPPRRSGRRVP